MLTLIRFAFVIFSLVCLFAIWTPVMLRGFWPYTESFKEFETVKTYRIEVMAMIWTAYWLLVWANIFVATYVFQAPLSVRAILLWLLIVAFALILVLSFHLTQINRRKKLSNPVGTT